MGERGDVLAYAPGARTPSFSTDDFGFRHTRFEDRDIGIANIEDYERIGFVLGSSHIFGFPLGHNGETLPSRLSERFGYPVFGIAYPEADTRTLHATLLRLLRQFAKRTEHVILITGGDFTRYCYVEGADPLFGPPILPVDARFRPAADTETEFANFLHFTRFWTKACGELARSRYRLLPWRRHHLLREIHARRHGKGLRAWVGVRRGATEAVAPIGATSKRPWRRGAKLRKLAGSSSSATPKPMSCSSSTSTTIAPRVRASLPSASPRRSPEQGSVPRDHSLGRRLSSAASPSPTPLSSVTACTA